MIFLIVEIFFFDALTFCVAERCPFARNEGRIRSSKTAVNRFFLHEEVDQKRVERKICRWQMMNDDEKVVIMSEVVAA